MHRLMFFLVAAASFLAKNLAAFLIVESLLEGYMFIASTDAILTLFLFTSSYSSFSFRSIKYNRYCKKIHGCTIEMTL